MAHAIRQFQEERNQWEAEKEELEQAWSQVLGEKTEAQQAAIRLAEEVERLRIAKLAAEASAQAALASSGPGFVRESIVGRTKDENEQLQKMLSNMKSTLELEQTRSKKLERQVSIAEEKTQGIADELERTKVVTEDLDSTNRTMLGQLSSEDAKLVTVVQEKQKEVLSLEDELISLREELNVEKKRVIHLKEAAYARNRKWKAELVIISEEIALKLRLEEEVDIQRQAMIRLREDVAIAKDREATFRREAEMSKREVETMKRDVEVANSRAERLQRELVGTKENITQWKSAVDAAADISQRRRSDNASGHDAEALSFSVTNELIKLEHELAEQVKSNTRLANLVQLFLEHAVAPLTTVRSTCKNFVATGEANIGVRQRVAPPLHEPKVQDAREALVSIVTLLRFCHEVLQAYQKERSEATFKTQTAALANDTSYAKGIMLAFG